MEQARHLLSRLGAVPSAYQKLESHSRNASLDIAVEEKRLQHTIRILRRWLFLMGVLLSLSLLALGANLALQHRSSMAQRSPIPRLPSKTVTFEADKRFHSRSSPDSDQAWFSLFPAGQGFVLVGEPAEYDLKPGLPANPGVTGQMYDIAAFHQLYCLTSIREYLWHLKFAVDTNKTEEIRPILLDPEEDHILSCFDYLRQSIMCSADTTLEWPQEKSNNRRAVVDGWGVPHQCVDWDALLEHTKKNEYSAE